MLVQGGNLAVAGAQLPPGAAYPLIRTSNSVGWLSNNMNGFRAQLQVALSEQFNGCQAAYANGFNAAAYSKTSWSNIAHTAATATTISTLANTTNYKGDLTVVNFGAGYQLNSALRLVGSIGTQELTATVSNPSRRLSHSTIGALYTQGAMTYKISYNQGARSDGNADSNGTAVASHDGTKQSQVALGAVYDLSKRTALYGTYDNQTTNAGTGSATGLKAGLSGFSGMFSQALVANGKATTSGVDIGIRHRF